MSTHNSYLKRREAIVIGIEATRGATATPSYTYRWLDKGLSTKPGILENESGVGDDYRVNDSAIDTNHAEGPLGGKVTETGITYLERLMMPKVTTVNNGNGTYTHNFEYDPNIEAKSASIWDVRPSGTRLYKSVVMDNLDVEVEAGENGAWVTSSSTLKGFKHQNVSAVTPALDVDELEFTSRHVKVYLADDSDGLADTATSRILVRRIKISRQQTKTVDHALGEGDTPEFDKGPFEATGEMVIKYRKTDFEDDFFSNAVHALRVVIENGDSSVEYIGTKVRFRELTDSDDRDAIVTQAITFAFEADHANGGHAIKSSVTNALATI